MRPPPIVIGPDQLPHCGACGNEFALCGYHRAQIERGLDGLASATTLGRSAVDLRYIVGKRPPRTMGDP